MGRFSGHFVFLRSIFLHEATILPERHWIQVVSRQWRAAKTNQKAAKLERYEDYDGHTFLLRALAQPLVNG